MAQFFYLQIPQWNKGSTVLAGGTVNFFIASSSTPQNVYSDSTGGTSLGSVVTLDANGQAQIWLAAAAYKIILKDSAGVTVLTVDNFNPTNVNTTVTSLTDTGDLTMQQSTAATSGANQSSHILKVQGNYWNGSASAVDEWDIQDVLGSGTNPTSSLTISHSGSSGTAKVNIPGNETIGGTLGVTGLTTLAALTATGNVTATAGANQIKAYNFNSVIWLDGINYTTLAAAYAAIPTATFAASGDGIGNVWTGGGGVVEVPPGWSESSAWSSDLVLKNCASIHFNGPAYFNQGTHQVTMAGNIHGVSIINPYGDHSNRTSGVTFDYSGNGDAWAIGDGGNNTPVSDIRIENIQVHTINGGLASNALHVHGSQYCNFINLDLVVANGATNTGNGLLMDGTGTNVFNTQNVLQGLTINFANNPVSFTGVNTDNVYIGGLIGNPHGTGGPAFSIAGSSTRNLFLNTAILSGTFASMYNFGGTANGNKVIAAANTGFVTTTVIFGATATNNTFDCIDGSPSVTDSGTGNSVLDPATFKRTQAGKIATYNGIATVGNGVASELARIDRTGDNNNVGTTTLYAVPANGAGTYRVHIYEIVTTVASTGAATSTLPSVVIGWTDQNNNTAQTLTVTGSAPTGNLLTTVNFGTFIVNAKASTNITYATTSYASNTANQMQYATTITCEKV